MNFSCTLKIQYLLATSVLLFNEFYNFVADVAKKLPLLGYADFDTLIEKNRAFIDKTEFIAEFMNSDFEVNTILRPRRFGKSANLSMLRTFFSIDTPESYREFFGKSLLGKNPEFISHYFRRFPALY